MNKCFLIEKITTKINFKFILNNKKYYSIAIFKIKIEKEKIEIKAYNEKADYCLKNLKEKNKIILIGYLNKNNVVIEEIKK